MAEALRQLVGEQNYKQDEVLAPGYYTGTTLLLCWYIPGITLVLHYYPLLYWYYYPVLHYYTVLHGYYSSTKSNIIKLQIIQFIESQL